MAKRKGKTKEMWPCIGILVTLVFVQHFEAQGRQHPMPDRAVVSKGSEESYFYMEASASSVNSAGTFGSNILLFPNNNPLENLVPSEASTVSAFGNNALRFLNIFFYLKPTIEGISREFCPFNLMHNCEWHSNAFSGISHLRWCAEMSIFQLYYAFIIFESPSSLPDDDCELWWCWSLTRVHQQLICTITCKFYISNLCRKKCLEIWPLNEPTPLFYQMSHKTVSIIYPNNAEEKVFAIRFKSFYFVKTYIQFSSQLILRAQLLFRFISSIGHAAASLEEGWKHPRGCI